MYPDYPTLSNIAYYVDTHPVYKASFNEYTEEDHADVKMIYKILCKRMPPDFEQDFIRQVGKRMDSEGGIDALRGCLACFNIAMSLISEDIENEDDEEVINENITEMPTVIHKVFDMLEYGSF